MQKFATPGTLTKYAPLNLEPSNNSNKTNIIKFIGKILESLKFHPRLDSNLEFTRPFKFCKFIHSQLFQNWDKFM